MMRIKTVCLLLLTMDCFVSTATFCQADNEIQVYASPTTLPKQTFIELHNNYTFKGPKTLADPKSARWVNNTLEITHGFTKNFELGFYTFLALSPDQKYMYLGNNIRPRVSAPDTWKLPVGVSLSVEFGRFRNNVYVPFHWQGEIRPIIDKTMGNWYASFNPNISVIASGPDKEMEFTPQAKVMYSVQKKFGLGVEYYTGLGTFKKLLPVKEQEHLLGPMFDLLSSSIWEVQTGFLFGLTPGSNQSIVKLLVGIRI